MEIAHATNQVVNSVSERLDLAPTCSVDRDACDDAVDLNKPVGNVRADTPGSVWVHVRDGRAS